MNSDSTKRYLLQETGTDRFINRFGDCVRSAHDAVRFLSVTEALNWVRRNDVNIHITLVREETKLVPQTDYVVI